MAKTRKIAVIGECMIELRPGITDAGYSNSTIDAQIGYGGDTLNVATYLARLGIDVEYVTMLGDDPLSDWMVEQWRDNNYRHRQWPDIAKAQAAFEAMYHLTDIAFPTAAGDSFNAGYLAARFGGASPEEAAKKGSRLAALVVQHRGAIIPRDAMQLDA